MFGQKLCLALSIIAVYFCVIVAPSLAADILVNENCTLANAIVAANRDIAHLGCTAGSGSDTIVLSNDNVLSASLPAITSNITIEGNGYSVSGDGKYRILGVRSGNLTINELRLADGYAEDVGGALASLEAAKVTINNSVIEGSWAEEGGAIWHVGPIVVHNSTVINNRAEIGGAVRNRGSVLTITNSHFANNRAGCASKRDSCDSHFGEYSGNGGAIYSRASSDILIYNSTFSSNTAPGDGGAIFAYDNLTIVNSTFVGNRADTAGGIIMNAGLSPAIRLSNNIIAGNAGGDCVGFKYGMSDNFIGDGSCFADFSGDPALDELYQPNDGSPGYFPLLADSLAIDTGRNCPQSDQVGTRRPQGSACDLGSIEYVSAEILADTESRATADSVAAADSIVTAESRATEGLCNVTTTHSLNFRADPGGRIIGNVPRNTSHTSIGFSDGWHQIDYNNATGWISADYVIEEGFC